MMNLKKISKVAAVLVPLVLVVASGIFLAQEYSRYNATRSSWTEMMIGNDFWLSPANKHISLLTRDVVYMGEIIEINVDPQAPDNFEITLLSMQEVNAPKAYKIRLPNLVYEYGIKREEQTILPNGQESITPVLVDAEYLTTRLQPGTNVIFNVTQTISKQAPDYLSFIILRWQP
jgi:hypothetical protein